jgi:hypothetical protein|tara:strand:- start:600 stop:833 length:234 start_codon:yes stop_codon:yes gene_type:complete
VDKRAGEERYIKIKEDDAIQQTKIKDMGSQAAVELKGSTYEERCKWIEDKKSIGNDHFKNKEYGEAIDIYTASLCGL